MRQRCTVQIVSVFGDDIFGIDLTEIVQDKSLQFTLLSWRHTRAEKFQHAIEDLLFLFFQLANHHHSYRFFIALADDT